MSFKAKKISNDVKVGGFNETFSDEVDGRPYTEDTGFDTKANERPTASGGSAFSNQETESLSQYMLAEDDNATVSEPTPPADKGNASVGADPTGETVFMPSTVCEG